MLSGSTSVLLLFCLSFKVCHWKEGGREGGIMEGGREKGKEREGEVGREVGGKIR